VVIILNKWLYATTFYLEYVEDANIVVGLFYLLNFLRGFAYLVNYVAIS